MDAVQKQFRILLLFAILLITPLGFATKFYDGPLRIWIHNFFGGVLYDIFWCLVAAFVLPKARPLNIALWVFIATSILEILQLWHPPLLEWIRANFIGRTLIGTSFAWMDIPHYAAGCCVGAWLIRWLKRRSC